MISTSRFLPLGLLLLISLLPSFLHQARGDDGKGEKSAGSEGDDTPRFEAAFFKVTSGKLKGFRYQLTGRNESTASLERISSADIFLGVPFAQPPVEELRLEKPRQVKKWQGVRDALEIPRSCVPIHMLTSPDYSEDCLYLNLMLPSERNSSERQQRKFPILVFIHGGGYNVGGTFIDGYRTLADNFVSRGIIVVGIQYRLNFFGFFTDGSSPTHIQGNLGLWDQREALLWIRRNADSFSGDAERITVWGQSAGSTSLSLLTLSRHTRDLFHQAIEQSGSFLSPWAINEHVITSSLELARDQLKCGGNLTDRFEKPAEQRSGELKACLKQLPLEDILFGLSMTEMLRDGFELVAFNPHLDADFFSNLTLPELLREAPKKPSMIGFNSLEAMFLSLEYPDSVFAFHGPLTVSSADANGAWGSYNRSQFVEFIRSKVHPRLGVRQSTPKSAAKSLQTELIDMYAGRQATRRSYLANYTQLLSDLLFSLPIIWESRLKAKAGWPVYLYEFDHLSKELSSKLPFRGVVHGAEYPYTVGTQIFGFFELNDEDKAVKDFLIDSIAQFVKNGKPSTPSFNWPQLELSRTKLVRMVNGVAKIGELSAAENRDGNATLGGRLARWDEMSRRYNFAGFQGLPKFNASWLNGPS